MSDLTPQQEMFAQKYIACKCNASEAYRQSYDCKESSPQVVWNEASILLHNHEVAIRIQALQEEHAKRNEVTVDSLTAELEQAKSFAYSLDQASAAISAIMGKAKIHGFDKSLITLDIPTVVRRDLTGKKAKDLV